MSDAPGDQQPHDRGIRPDPGEDDPGADTEMFRAFMAGDRPMAPGGATDQGADEPAQRGGTSATRFRVVSFLVGLAVFVLLAWLLLRA